MAKSWRQMLLLLLGKMSVKPNHEEVVEVEVEVGDTLFVEESKGVLPQLRKKTQPVTNL